MSVSTLTSLHSEYRQRFRLRLWKPILNLDQSSLGHSPLSLLAWTQIWAALPPSMIKNQFSQPALWMWAALSPPPASSHVVSIYSGSLCTPQPFSPRPPSRELDSEATTLVPRRPLQWTRHSSNRSPSQEVFPFPNYICEGLKRTPPGPNVNARLPYWGLHNPTLRLALDVTNLNLNTYP